MKHSSEADKVLEANIVYHTATADIYDKIQPHFRPENVDRVNRIIANLAEKTGGGSLLDLGCGTGFIINIAKKHFRRVVGVDASPAMLARVDTSGDSKIELYEGNTGELPFSDTSFDVCTAYSFLHHLYDLRPTLTEAYRCLRPGGLFYAGLEPNRHYWLLMDSLVGQDELPEVLAREVRSVVTVADDLETELGVSAEDIALAEYQKIKKGGFDPDSIAAYFRELGFETADFSYDWYLGQGKVIHQQSESIANAIDEFLRERLPATRNLFKYLSFYAQKGK